jgi:hypothetical protein
VVYYAAAQPDLWIAPLSEIADWQQSISHVTTSVKRQYSARTAYGEQPMVFSVSNESAQDIAGLALELPFAVGRAAVDGKMLALTPAVPGSQFLVLDIQAHQTLEVEAWPTT